jgi:hypothetical protein
MMKRTEQKCFEAAPSLQSMEGVRRKNILFMIKLRFEKSVGDII